jgi:hypothetical protein
MSRTMRFVTLFTIVVAVVAAHANAAEKPTEPRLRPAVLRSGANSLVNLIDAAALLKNGQKDGAVMFCAVVAETGHVIGSWTYRGTPETDALVREVKKGLSRVKFTPPIYNHQPVKVLLYGTVMFSATEEPHLWIFLNQDPQELKRRSDFVAPQPVMGGDSKFKGLNPPEDVPLPISGMVGMKFTVDANGALLNLEVINEEPPLLGFAAAAHQDFQGAKFIPGFRSGDATDSDSVMIVCYKADDEVE